MFPFDVFLKPGSNLGPGIRRLRPRPAKCAAGFFRDALAVLVGDGQTSVVFAPEIAVEHLAAAWVAIFLDGPAYPGEPLSSESHAK